MKRDIFPSKLAVGSQFCNRVIERRLLASNIDRARHTVLVSPRRYGKSSLVHYVINELDYPFVSIDLFLAHDDNTVVKRLLVAISDAITQLLPVNEKALKQLQTLFKRFLISMSVGAFHIELAREQGEIDAVDKVYDALSALSKLAAKEKKKLIIFIDEFQDIVAAQSAKSIQGAIRHIAQETDDLVFLFSGSNRHLLTQMFDDKTMPLYMLCDKLNLERMSGAEYFPFIQRLAKKQWGKPLPDMVFRKIMTLTELHPFYVNFLCHKIWQGKLPTVGSVEQDWHQCMDIESRRIRAELDKLSRKQQDMMKALAVAPTDAPTGQAFSAKSGLATSSLFQMLNVLQEKDMVFTVRQEDDYVAVFKAGQVRVLDPLIAYYLKQYAN